MLIILLILYYFMENLFQKFWNILPNPKLEINQKIKFDQSVIELFLGKNLNYCKVQ